MTAESGMAGVLGGWKKLIAKDAKVAGNAGGARIFFGPSHLGGKNPKSQNPKSQKNLKSQNLKKQGLLKRC
jgi:hypothetical protein